MKLLSTLIPFVVALGVLIVFHELGHFVVARACKVKVLRFSLGFGPPLWRRSFGPDRTEWVVAAIPFGGYVKMLDEREQPVAAEEVERAFNRRPIWQRMAIVVAGPAANLLMATGLFAAIYMHGVEGTRSVFAAPPNATPALSAGLQDQDEIIAIDGESVNSVQDVQWKLLERIGHPQTTLTVKRAEGQAVNLALSLQDIQAKDWEGDFFKKLGLRLLPQPPVLGDIDPGKPADLAGLRQGDRIKAIDGRSIDTWENFVSYVSGHPDQTLHLSVERAGGVFNADVHTLRVDVSGQSIGRVGVRIDETQLERLRVVTHYGLAVAVVRGAKRTWDLSVFTLKMLYRIVTGESSLKNISGPITMADYAGQSAQQGFWVYLGYLALVSISLGVLNLLPIPVLDGGHLMYHTAELIKGSPVPERVLFVGQQIGIVILCALLGLALYNDVARLLS